MNATPIQGPACAALLLALSGLAVGQESTAPSPAATPSDSAASSRTQAPAGIDTPVGDTAAAATPDSLTESVRATPDTGTTMTESVQDTAMDAPTGAALPKAAKVDAAKTVVVKGKLRGKAQDRRKRQDSDVRKDVIGIDAIRERADADAASALSRSGGVTLQRSQGEGRFVQIRGTEARLSTVTMNGQKVASSDGDTRAVGLDVIPVDQLSEIEVTKVLMPEMDGDAIGGNVNLVTPSAQDTQLVFRGFFASGWNALPEKPLWQGSVALSRRFLEGGALGAYVGGSWYQSVTGRDAVGIGWDTLDHSKIWELQLRRYRTEKVRQGLNGRLDWRLGGASLVYATGSWSRCESDQLRERLELDRTGHGDLSPYVDSSTNVDVSRSIKKRVRTETVALGSVGASTGIGAVRLDAAVTGTESRTRQPLSTQATFVPTSRLNVAIHPDDPDVPEYYAFWYPRPIGRDQRLSQAGSYVLSRLDPQAMDARESDLHARLDARLSLLDSSVQIKSGLKLGTKEKRQSVSGASYSFLTDASRPNLTSFDPSSGDASFYQGHYDLGAFPSSAAVDSWLASHRELLIEKAQDNHLTFDPQNYLVEENHLAGYGQARWKTGDVVAVGGLRYERFDLRSTGNDVRLQADESWDTTVSVTKDRTMQFLLPMASVRWEPSTGLVLRAGATRSFVLPDTRDLVPTRRTDLLDYVIEEGNPDLKPTLAVGGDLGAEWFHRGRGMLGVGLFAKSLEDYVFPSTWTSWDPIRKVVFTHYGKANGEDASIWGAELEAAQPFHFLPGPLAGLGVEANWTRTWSSTVLPGRTASERLPGQVDQSGTAALRFERWGFTALLSWTWQGDMRHEIAPVRERDTWVEGSGRMDASLSQRLGKGWLVFVQAGNLTDAAHRIHEGDAAHPIQIEYTGITGQCGLRVSL